MSVYLQFCKSSTSKVLGNTIIDPHRWEISEACICEGTGAVCGRGFAPREDTILFADGLDWLVAPIISSSGSCGYERMLKM